jgi:hypothetical protein
MNCPHKRESNAALQQSQFRKPACIWVALCYLLLAADSLHAQQPVLVQACELLLALLNLLTGAIVRRLMPGHETS